MNSPNKALDRTAVSALSSVIADSWPVAALMAVGQLGRSAPSKRAPRRETDGMSGHAGFVRWLPTIAGMGVCLIGSFCSAQEPKERAILKGHVANVPNLVFSADGMMLVSGGWDATTRLWDVASGKQLATFKDRTAKIWSVAITADSQSVASGSDDGTITLWDVGRGTKRTAYKGDPEAIRSLAFSSNGKTLGSGDDNGTLKHRDRAAGKA